jgi:hypothetical protein
MSTRATLLLPIDRTPGAASRGASCTQAWLWWCEDPSVAAALRLW